ncbi:MAG: hypothetical protein ACK2U9_14970, partial [Anaerolineae bacterium]
MVQGQQPPISSQSSGNSQRRHASGTSRCFGERIVGVMDTRPVVVRFVAWEASRRDRSPDR